MRCASQQRGSLLGGVDALWAKIVEIGTEFGLTLATSRDRRGRGLPGVGSDLCRDVQVVCKSNFRPVYPNTVSPQTFQFGKGEVVVRLYDKTAQIAR